MRAAIALLVAACTRPGAGTGDLGTATGESARGVIKDAGEARRERANMDCSVIGKKIANRDFIGWTGIPVACDAAALFGAPPADLASRPRRNLGDDFTPATFWVLELPGYYRPTASFVDGKLVLFDGMNPELASGFAVLRDDLGAPAARLDWEHGTLKISGGEWAYPARGITVFVDPDAPDTALHIAVFHATTLETYRRALRPHLGKQLLPRR
jgi:hypothetical protein